MKLRALIHLPGVLLLCGIGLAADMLGLDDPADWCAAQLQQFHQAAASAGTIGEWIADAVCILICALTLLLAYIVL